MNFIAFTVKGLEQIVSEEIRETIYDAQIQEVGDKRVLFSSNTAYEKLTLLRTADDIGMLVGRKDSEITLDSVIKTLLDVDFYAVQNNFAGYRKLLPGIFSITVSVVGAPSISQDELVKQAETLISNKYHWKVVEKDHTNFDVRIFIDHKQLYISVRLAQQSLHHRSYKIVSQEGSLRPTIAAAMVRLGTNDQNDLHIVDTFCGSGTILCEAFIAENEVYGGDIDPDAVSITKENVKQIGDIKEDQIKVQNAMNTRWPDDYFDVAISNLPWNKQIEVASITDLYIGTLAEYKRIMKENSTICVLVSKPELFIKHAKAYFPRAKIDSLKLSFTGQSPSIILITQTGYNDSYDLL